MVVFLNSESDIARFQRTTRYNEGVAHTVTSLHVNLRDRPNQVRPLNECLRMAKNLEDITLMLPRLSSYGWRRMFRDVHLPNLSMVASNAPHDVVAIFGQRHQTITHLKLGASAPQCVNCPLSNNVLPNLSYLTGSYSCVTSIAATQLLDHIHACYVSSPGDGPHTLSQLTTRLLGTVRAYNLTEMVLEIDPTDFDIVDRVAINVPSVTKLWLLEVLPVGVVSSNHTFSSFSKIKILLIEAARAREACVERCSSMGRVTWQPQPSIAVCLADKTFSYVR